ncbi:MAG: hypothetical protein M0Z79_08445 [Nitrospiraceae bacterium]|nr:hypothetical protein [Nitrospiraceae bacterium]
MTFLKGMLSFLLSLRTSIRLMLLLLALLFYGSFIMPLNEEFQALHTVPLFPWLAESPIAITWWLLAAIAVLSLLTANTLLCSLESLIKKRGSRQFFLVVSPQVIHLGFLFILLAHLFSSYDSFRGMTYVAEGTRLPLPNSTSILFERINAAISPSGYITDWSAEITRFDELGQPAGRSVISPNNPAFFKGFGIYIKTVRPGPFTTALIEVGRDPGAVWALAGGILFLTGMITLLIVKIRREDAAEA